MMNFFTGDVLIRKGEHCGWSVHFHSNPQTVPSAAYFSTIPEMLAWLKAELEKSG